MNVFSRWVLDWGWVDNEGGLGDGGGLWSDGVCSWCRADIGRGHNLAGDDAVLGDYRCDGADDGRRGLYNGGYSSVGVGSGWDLGGCGRAHGG